MSKLFFYYSTMNAGKSTNLLQASYNYKEMGFNTILFTFEKDDRNYGKEKNKYKQLDLDFFSLFKKSDNDNKKETIQKNGLISSRIGINEQAYTFNNNTSFIKNLKTIFNIEEKDKKEGVENLTTKLKEEKIGAIFIDEAQFLTEKQVKELAYIVDFCNIPVLCYGLRTDFLGNIFEGSKWLLGWADELVEMKTICSTGKKATFVLRLDENGNVVKNGEQVMIGGNDKYLSVSRKIHYEKLNN